MDFLSLLPLILKVLGFFLDWYGASEVTLQKYQDLIISTHNDGKISIDTKDKLTAQRAAILARVKAKIDSAAPKA